MPLEDLVDRRDRDIHLMEALEIETNPDRRVLPLGPDAQDEGHDMRRRGEMGLARSGFQALQPLESVFAVPI
jgi:hypothetical protein